MTARTLMVFDIHSRKNKRDERYHEIEMIDDETGEYVKTYATEGMFNFDNWEPVIDSWQPKTLLAITGVFKFKRDPKTKQFTNIINADSKPHVNESYDQSVRDQYLQLYAERHL